MGVGEGLFQSCCSGVVGTVFVQGLPPVLLGQPCRGTPRGLSRGCVGVPCRARASSSLALALGAAQEAPAGHLLQAGSISQPSHCALSDGEGFIQGGRRILHPLRAALPANTSPLSAPGLSQS